MARSYQRREAILYSVVVWTHAKDSPGMPDVWLVKATYQGQARKKVKDHYQQQDWPDIRSIRARKVSNADIQRVL